jgi:hypothetical protein
VPDVRRLYTWQRIAEEFGASEAALSSAINSAYDIFDEIRQDGYREEDQSFKDALRVALSDMLVTSRRSD